MRMTDRRPYVALAAGLAIGGLVATLLARKRVRDSLREPAKQGVELVKERATKLRAAAQEIVKRTKEFVGPRRNQVETDTEAARQAYQEDKRENLGG